MLQLADIPHKKPLDTSHTSSMTPSTHSDSQTHFGLFKAALKSWLVSILHFFVSFNTHARCRHHSKFACGCTYPSPHSTRLNTSSPTTPFLLERAPVQCAACIGFAQHTPNANLCATAACYPADSFSSTSSPTSILPSIFFDYSISNRFLGLLGLLPESLAVCIAAINALSWHSRSSLSNANVLMP